MPTPVGGSGRLAQLLAELIQKHGGTVETGRHVERVLVKDGRARGVRLSDNWPTTDNGETRPTAIDPQSVATG